MIPEHGEIALFLLGRRDYTCTQLSFKKIGEYGILRLPTSEVLTVSFFRALSLSWKPFKAEDWFLHHFQLYSWALGLSFSGAL